MMKPINILFVCLTALTTLASCVGEEGHTITPPPTLEVDWVDTLVDERYIIDNDTDSSAMPFDVEWILLQRYAVITPKTDMILTSPYLPWTGTITINSVNYDPNTFSYNKQLLSNFFTISNDSVTIKVFDDHIEVYTPSYFDQTGNFDYNSDSITLVSSEPGFSIDIQAPPKTLLAKNRYRFAETRTPEEKMDTLMFQSAPDSIVYGKGTTIIGVNWNFNGPFSTSSADNLEILIENSTPNGYIGNKYDYEYHLIKDKDATDGIVNGLILYEEKNIMGIVGRSLYAGIGFEDYQVHKVEIEHEYYHQ
ncbi:MAG: hypothetical protein ACK5IQ_11530 [Bacteroidales bacterium]